MAHELLNISQVANLLKCSVRSLYRMIENGEFPKGHIIAGSQRWYFDEIEDAIRFGSTSSKNRMSNGA